jgi:hypothetical protein
MVGIVPEAKPMMTMRPHHAMARKAAALASYLLKIWSDAQ